MNFPSPLFVGIFGYLNFRVSKDRKYILETLVKGLQRLEYRGYDSAGKLLSSYLSAGVTVCINFKC